MEHSENTLPSPESASEDSGVDTLRKCGVQRVELSGMRWFNGGEIFDFLGGGPFTHNQKQNLEHFLYHCTFKR